jgi:hypothetical protein
VKYLDQGGRRAVSRSVESRRPPPERRAPGRTPRSREPCKAASSWGETPRSTGQLLTRPGTRFLVALGLGVERLTFDKARGPWQGPPARRSSTPARRMGSSLAGQHGCGPLPG